VPAGGARRARAAGREPLDRTTLRPKGRRHLPGLHTAFMPAMLRQTDLHLNEIAQRAGFSTTAHLCRLFHARLGETPTQYRKSHKAKR
jgi:methylphosphotriester-DNA--protein-cysteine methyltransferase